ncbi:MAG: hypothetical protein JO235_25310 [Chroococcidiopsidaceae cyanobacterium CP_BM_RX_35]|nr:hypothetical protein [Chroococcidiopsidaceae cyanobacterium CP_BM_RX_35]
MLYLGDLVVRAIFPSLLLVIPLIGLSLGQFLPCGATPCTSEVEDAEALGEVVADSEGEAEPEGEAVADSEGKADVALLLGALADSLLADSSVLLLHPKSASTTRSTKLVTATR